MLTITQLHLLLRGAFRPVAPELQVDADSGLATLDIVAYDHLHALASVRMDIELLRQPAVLFACVRHLRAVLTDAGCRLEPWEPVAHDPG